MGKIFCLMGKSSCGKDTLYKRILSDPSLPLQTLVPYTTRPMRDGETEGVEYYFRTESQRQGPGTPGKNIELRSYETVHGIWKYFTVNDHQIHLERHNYLLIGTLESFKKLRSYFGPDTLVPIYIELEDGERLQRALNRERLQTVPGYTELCRRFLADEKDFSQENLQKAGITLSFSNHDLEICTENIISFIKANMDKVTSS